MADREYVEVVDVAGWDPGLQLEISHGSCVSLVQAGNFTALAVSICRSLDEEGILEEGGVTRGHCNQAVKEFLEGFFGGPLP